MLQYFDYIKEMVDRKCIKKGKKHTKKPNTKRYNKKSQSQ